MKGWKFFFGKDENEMLAGRWDLQRQDPEIPSHQQWLVWLIPFLKVVSS